MLMSAKTADLFLPEHFMDEKEKLKMYLSKAIDRVVNANQNKTEPYFIVLHEKADSSVSQMKIHIKSRLPGFVTNQIVFWVSNQRGICEWLWTVPPKEPGKKLRVEFNTSYSKLR